MFNKLKNRSPQSKMLLAISFGVAVGLIPFAFFRLNTEDWLVAALDAFIILEMTGLFLYVYVTDNEKVAGILLIVLALTANLLSFYIKGVSQVYWIYPAMLSAYYVIKPSIGLMVNFVMLSLYIPKLFSTQEIVNIATMLITIIMTNMIAYVFASGLRKQQKELLKLASEDYLTSTGNRRALNKCLQEIHATLKNHDKTASLILLDLDHFKKINDTYGHIEGDKILVEVSQLILSNTKDANRVFRYGGEEFLICCPNVSDEEAYNKANDIRNTIKSAINIDGNILTVSLGLSEYIKEESIDEWVHRVDMALYQAKNQGRDCVVKA